LTKEEIDQWKNFFEENKKNKIKSKYEGLCFNNYDKQWYVYITRNKQRIFTYHNKNDMIVARKRDMFIMNNLRDELDLLNFEWDDNDIRYWTTYFEFVRIY